MSKELTAKDRFERKGKLLSNMQLKYPNNEELNKLAELAKVDDQSRFGSHICSIILDAHLHNASLRSLSIPEVRKNLNTVMRAARDLTSVLERMDVGTKGSREHAGRRLEYEIGNFEFRGGAVLIPGYIQLLIALKDAAYSAAITLPKADRGPKGAGGNIAFNWFIEALIMAARQRQGRWTNYRSAGGPWTGSLIKALKILKPYLPLDFFPRARLGRSVEHIRKNFKDSTNKPRSEP